MAYFDLDHFYDPSTGEHRITDEGMADLKHLITIVLNKHFSKVRPDKKEDLMQLGWYKVFKTFKQGQFDPARSSLKNYLYTGIRNEMGNFIARSSKEQLLDNSLIEQGFLTDEYDEDGAPVDDNNGQNGATDDVYRPSDSWILRREEIEVVVNRFPRVEQIWNRLAVYFDKFGIQTDWGEKVGSSDEEGSDIAAIAALCVWHYRRNH